MKSIIPIQKLPIIPLESPDIVKTLDKIRFLLDKSDDSDEYAEFYWFAREYPRVYRHHFSHVEYRLKSIHEKYSCAYKYFDDELKKDPNESIFSLSFENQLSNIVYWEFEALLNATSSALDVIARIVGTAYDDQLPVSFNKIIKKSNLGGCISVLSKAKQSWISKLKDYRDCFVHYTCTDTILTFSCQEYKNGFQIRCKIPTNPNARDILKFRWSRKSDILNYCISIYKNLSLLDRSVAKEIWKAYCNLEYPKRTSNLFFIGSRE